MIIWFISDIFVLASLSSVWLVAKLAGEWKS